MATIKDVARRAGVAISTVSAVINGSAPVSAEVSGRVQQVISEIGYVPHGLAQSLRSGQSRLIGLLIPNITNPHFSEVAQVIENACLKAGYMSVVYSSGQDPEREAQILTMMRQHRVAGLVIIPTRSDRDHGARLALAIHVPTVLLDMIVEGLPYDIVKMDNVKATSTATRHLLELGHRRIAFTAGIPGLATSEDRLAGYRQALRNAGISPEERLVIRGDFREAMAYAGTLELMGQPNPPTAILSISNMATLGVMKALRASGRSIPEDVSVVGIDDLYFAEVLDPPPTVIRVPVAEMAEAAISNLLSQLTTKQAPTGTMQLFEPMLVIRHSSAGVSQR